MKKRIEYLCLMLIAILILSSCSYNNSPKYLKGIQVVNNSSKQIKSIGVTNAATSQHADNSFIKKGEAFFFDFPLFNINDYKFSIIVIDKDDIKYESQVFTKDFSVDALYYIYIIYSQDGGLAFSDKSDSK